MICVSIGRTRHSAFVQEHRNLAEQGAKLIELRVDWLRNMPNLAQLITNRPTPVIVTCRRKEDRGRWLGTEETRQALLREAIVAGVEYVDLEMDIAKSIRRFGTTKRIVSYHNFDETPLDLDAIHRQMQQLDPDIIKIVTMANTPGDVTRMLQLVSESRIPTAGFCMGELGVPSRILCGKYGSPFTYATFSRDRELAPGQIPFEDMRDIYHYDDINAETTVFGVVGDPIGHSMSPLIHNAALRAAGINAVYIPFRIPSGTLAQSLNDMNWLQLRGLSVTIPHKEAAAALAQHCNTITQAVGAANTLVRNEVGGWDASNTDYEAILESVLLGLDPQNPDPVKLMGQKVLLLGAGGAARAAAMAMARNGAVVTISSRTHKRATALAAEMGCQHCSWENRGSVDPNIVINCTPVGMHPNVDESPIPANWLMPGMLVFDTVYNPENTLLLKYAKQRECRIVTGIEMFVRQAARQFDKFTGQPASLDLMRATLRQAISPVRINYQPEDTP